LQPNVSIESGLRPKVYEAGCSILSSYLDDAVTRRRKLLTVGAILATGLVLAWPFRKVGSDTNAPAPAALQPADMPRASNGDPIAESQPSTPMPGVPIAPAQVAVQPASTVAASESSHDPQTLGSFDLANHPALVEHNSSPPVNHRTDLVTPTTQPAYETASAAPLTTVEQWPAELVHVVANGDTLEKLAERYLNDAGRALEIFDLNRDQLSNPHLLPIGVELRVPRNPDRIMD
jgi:nucleoid-associated protein YgaU